MKIVVNYNFYDKIIFGKYYKFFGTFFNELSCDKNKTVYKFVSVYHRPIFFIYLMFIHITTSFSCTNKSTLIFVQYVGACRYVLRKYGTWTNTTQTCTKERDCASCQLYCVFVAVETWEFVVYKVQRTMS